MTSAAPRTADLQGARPVLLHNPQGWGNVTRFATLTMAKLSTLERRVACSSASALCRALQKVEKRNLREGFVTLHQNSTLDTFVNARSHAEDMLQRLHTLVDTFDIEVDTLVEDIMQGTLEEDEAACPRS
mmetsp:Transcript_81682/g.142060  ORF Transcript_81682/g.142060 Transcript_81682/m.142060 type:complete len:130 (-) Transcript_81682:73-462(-)